MDEKIKLLKSQLGDNRIKENICLADYCKSGQSHFARALYLATTIREFIKSIELCWEIELNYLIVGSGSKVQLPWQNFSGLIIKNRADQIKISGIKGKVSGNGLGIEQAYLEAESGSSLSSLANFAKKQKLAGLESFELDSETIGGSILSNENLQKSAYQVKVFEDGEIVTKQPGEVAPGDVITAVIFALKADFDSDKL